MTASTEKPAEKGRKPRAPLKIARFRLGVLAAAAMTVLVCGGVLLGAAVESRFAWLAAIAKGPPPYKALGAGAFEQEGLAGEVALRAQIDSPRAYYVASDGGQAFAAPLYPPEAAHPSDPVTAVLLEPAGAPAEADFANWVRTLGPAGVVVEFLGRRYSPDAATRERVAEALAAEGLRLAPDAVFVDPHHRPRRVELAPSSFGVGFGASVIAVGALIGLFIVTSLELNRRRRVRPEKIVAVAPAPAEAAKPPEPPQQTEAPQAPAEPKPLPEPQPEPAVDPEPSKAPAPEVATEPAQSEQPAEEPAAAQTAPNEDASETTATGEATEPPEAPEGSAAPEAEGAQAEDASEAAPADVAVAGQAEREADKPEAASTDAEAAAQNKP